MSVPATGITTLPKTWASLLSCPPLPSFKLTKEKTGRYILLQIQHTSMRRQKSSCLHFPEKQNYPKLNVFLSVTSGFKFLLRLSLPSATSVSSTLKTHMRISALEAGSHLSRQAHNHIRSITEQPRREEPRVRSLPLVLPKDPVPSHFS